MDWARLQQLHLVDNFERQWGELPAHIWQEPNCGRRPQSKEIKHELRRRTA